MIYLSLLSLLDTKQTTNSSRRPIFQDSRASCLQHPGGMWECGALRLPPLFCIKHHSLMVHSPSPVNLFFVQPFTLLCYGRKMSMNFSGGLFCNHTRSSWERRSEQGLWLKRGFEFLWPSIFRLNQRGWNFTSVISYLAAKTSLRFFAKARVLQKTQLPTPSTKISFGYIFTNL